MPKNYINIDLPAGMRSNGTEYANRGAWVDGSRVRWQRNALRPIGGWGRFSVASGYLNAIITNPDGEIARSLSAWRNNEGGSLYAVGTNKKLKAWGMADAVVHDITPVDFTERSPGVASADGYGDWFYGLDSYGTVRPVDAERLTTFSWCLRQWGQNLLAAPRGAPSKLYQWDTSFSNRAVTVANAPVNFDCFHVADQRIILTAGSPTDPRLVQWSDRENATEWSPQINNLAGFQNVPGVGRFLDIITVQDQYIFVSETDVHAARFIGAPYVFSFDQIGDRCGALSAMSIVTTEDFAMWPGSNCFFMCDGSSVRRVECDVMDSIAEFVNSPKSTKMQGFVNPGWSEIWWLYQSGQNDLDSYIFYDWVSQTWGQGKLDRVIGGGHSTTGGLIMLDRQGYAYSHELPGVLPIDDGEAPSAVFARTGPIELSSGNTTQYVKAVQPDFITEGRVNVTLIGRDRPGAKAKNFGPYTIDYPAKADQPVPVRARGHTISLLVEGLEGSWTLGSMRLDFSTGGEK